MDFYYRIKDLSEEQIRELISLKIDRLTYKSYRFSNRFIGVDCDINPKLNFDGEIPSASQAMWQGFIPKDIRINYNHVLDENGYVVNNGCYYYMDDDEYIYEFANYIKKIDITTEFDFLVLLQTFMERYFYNKWESDKDRVTFHRPLVNKDGKNIKRENGHSFRDFKKSNLAKCSEYSAMAQNILSVFDYQSLYFVGSAKIESTNDGHAFNMVAFNKGFYLVDFSMPVNVYSVNYEHIYSSPFLGEMGAFSPELIHESISKSIPFTFTDFHLLDINDTLYTVSTSNERSYVIGDIEFFKKNKNYQKKPKDL